MLICCIGGECKLVRVGSIFDIPTSALIVVSAYIIALLNKLLFGFLFENSFIAMNQASLDR